MYKALVSFTTSKYDVKLNQILPNDFDTQENIQDFLNAGYIREYNAGEDGIQSDNVSKIWTGTQEEYTGIATLDDNTLYFIREV